MNAPREHNKAARRVMVCVTAQWHCERLIREGSQLAHGGALSVVHVSPAGKPLLYGSSVDDDAKALEFLFSSARTFGADMIVEHNDNPLDAIAAMACRIGAQCIVLGVSDPKAASPFSKALADRLPGVTIHTVRSMV